MIRKIEFADQGIANYIDEKTGKKTPVKSICVDDCSGCEPKRPCGTEVMRVVNPDVPGEFYEINLVELARSLGALVVKTVSK